MLRPGCEPRCPGCSHRELEASESEFRKTDWLRRALGPWNGTLQPLRAVQGDSRWAYRDKTLLHAEWDGTQWRFGLRIAAKGARRGEFEIVAIPNCPVHSERVRGALSVLSEVLPPPSRFNLVFVSIAGAMLTLVVKSAPMDVQFAGDLARLGMEGVFLNFNASAGHRVFSSRGWVKVWGRDTAIGYLGVRYGPQSFQQLIPSLYEEALVEAGKWLAPSPGDFVVDLYSGLGASIHRWRRAGAECVGVELSGEAVRLSGLGEIDVLLRGKVSERIPQIRERSENRKAPKGKVVIFANPPRTGLEEEVLHWISAAENKPARIAYLSCSAGTLARDLSKLENSKYRVKRITPYDFFPQTHHVETLACLELDSG